MNDYYYYYGSDGTKILIGRFEELHNRGSCWNKYIGLCARCADTNVLCTFELLL